MSRGKTMKRACALMAVYNEADVVREAVSKLIQHGVDVHLIDNASTDGTAARVADLVGRGVIDIETVRFEEDGREVYDWTALLKLKEARSRTLGYDWYLHVDADEIRLPPWPGLSLREGLDRVAADGYQLVNFKLFNFRLTADLPPGAEADFESAMPLYSATERFNQRQVKAWRADPGVDLASLGGHHVRVPGGRVFPTRFIHKHYPVRSFEHGRRKIMAERKARFSKAEKARGWHVQYDHLADIGPRDVYWAESDLSRFVLEAECQALLAESSAVLAGAYAEQPPEQAMPVEAGFERRWVQRLQAGGVAPTHAVQLLAVASRLAQLIAGQDLPPVAANPDDRHWLQSILASLARVRFLAGDPTLWSRLPALRFN
jgi:Glycosyl transferase family 2